MLGKLMKYEWKAGWKIIVLINLFTVVMTILGGLSLGLLNTEEPSVFQILFLVMSFVFYMLTVYAVSIGCMAYVAVRFYKNIYSKEGYLMHTLPVTPRQLLLSKLIVNGGFYLLSTAMVFLSIVTLGVILVLKIEPSAFITFGEISEAFKSEFGMSFAGYIAFIISASLIGSISGILMIYVSIALGQLASKHKVLAAIGAYIALTTLIQTITTVVSFVFVMDMDTDAMINMQINGVYVMTLILSIIMSVVFYIITEVLMKKKLNLE